MTPDRVADYLAFFDEDAFRDYPAWSACYCMETMFWGDEAENAARTAGDNRRDMARLIEEGKVTALLAYAGGKPVGWCNYGPTTRLAGVVRKLQLDPADHDGVGSIACFVIASQYRGHGLARRLLDAACERLHGPGAGERSDRIRERSHPTPERIIGEDRHPTIGHADRRAIVAWIASRGRHRYLDDTGPR